MHLGIKKKKLYLIKCKSMCQKINKRFISSKQEHMYINIYANNTIKDFKLETHPSALSIERC